MFDGVALRDYVQFDTQFTIPYFGPVAGRTIYQIQITF